MTRTGINASAWMSTISTAGRFNVGAEPPKHSPFTTVDRWVNGKWEEWLLKWDGEKYVRVEKSQCEK